MYSILRGILAAWWNRIPAAAWGLMGLVAIFSNLLLGHSERRTSNSVLPDQCPIGALVQSFGVGGHAAKNPIMNMLAA